MILTNNLKESIKKNLNANTNKSNCILTMCYDLFHLILNILWQLSPILLSPLCLFFILSIGIISYAKISNKASLHMYFLLT